MRQADDTSTESTGSLVITCCSHPEGDGVAGAVGNGEERRQGEASSELNHLNSGVVGGGRERWREEEEDEEGRGESE